MSSSSKVLAAATSQVARVRVQEMFLSASSALLVSLTPESLLPESWLPESLPVSAWVFALSAAWEPLVPPQPVAARAAVRATAPNKNLFFLIASSFVIAFVRFSVTIPTDENNEKRFDSLYNGTALFPVGGWTHPLLGGKYPYKVFHTVVAHCLAYFLKLHIGFF